MVLAIIKFIMLIVTTWLEKDKDKKEKKKEILKEAKDAIKNKDTRASIAVFDKLNRL